MLSLNKLQNSPIAASYISDMIESVKDLNSHNQSTLLSQVIFFPKDAASFFFFFFSPGEEVFNSL